jgi:hypothetical protein
MDTGVAFFGMIQKTHQLVHAIQFKEPVFVIDMTFHAEINPAVNPVEGLLIMLILGRKRSLSSHLP